MGCDAFQQKLQKTHKEYKAKMAMWSHIKLGEEHEGFIHLHHLLNVVWAPSVALGQATLQLE